MDSSAVSLQRQPILSSLRVTANPGVSVGTAISDTPAAPGPPVRAATTTWSARVADVMYVLAPLITTSSPSRTAWVRRLATSEPPSGSVTPKDATISPARTGRTNRSSS